MSGTIKKGAIPLRERLTVDDEWRSFKDAIGLDTMGAGEAQKIETRRAFMAGARSMFALLTGGFDHGDQEPTELDLQYVTMLNQELDFFKRLVERGKA